MNILLVEDDAAMARLICEFLGKRGYQAKHAATAASALRGFAESRPDLVLLDVGLPDGDGYSVCRSLRASAGPELPIIFLTSHGDLNSRLKGFDAGAQDYLPKPFSLDELAARVGVHLRSGKSLADAVRGKSELEARERARQDMTDMIVHDLKVPLSSIQATLEIIRSHGLVTDGQFQWMLQASEIAAGMMLFMLNDMLDLARAKQAGLKAQRVPMDVSALLGKLASFFEPSFQRRSLTLRTALKLKAPLAETDQQLVYRILVNFVSNAMKFSPPKGEVLVCAEAREGALRLSVADSGPGVPDQEKLSIFEKFVQLPGPGRSLAMDRGSGIGLAFCKAAASALGGRVWVEDREGGGSCFLLELPGAFSAVSA